MRNSWDSAEVIYLPVCERQRGEIYVLITTRPCPLPSSLGCPPVCSGSGIWLERGSLWGRVGPPSERSAGPPTGRHDWQSHLTEGPWSLEGKRDSEGYLVRSTPELMSCAKNQLVQLLKVWIFTSLSESSGIVVFFVFCFFLQDQRMNQLIRTKTGCCSSNPTCNKSGQELKWLCNEDL